MKVEMIAGGEPDDNCLHCALAYFVQGFVNAHPEYRGDSMRLLTDVSQFVGELVGSGLYNSGRRNDIERIVAIVGGEVRRTAAQVIQTMDRTRTS